ncbi:DUF4189 domain-containing protein [Pseudomonas sp. UL073]|uniref:DUF4189 domain-containing protein n=1 Tax=Zestomonas insulae TaxID=2809017 RepID=A0ABS2IGT4_9GAMM|nr:DUF4189 domain-containing protein [Pseudomonas insulae]MBM7062281.1 DUF4189 domain-containing protein [Pseudomonas insulae]
MRTLATTLALSLALAVTSSQAWAAGALAIDSNQGDQFGFAYDYATLGEAQQRALGECGGNCQVVLDFDSGCAAYAADQSNGSTVYGWGTAESSGGAQQRALQECSNQGGNSCQVRTWGCNSN